MKLGTRPLALGGRLRCRCDHGGSELAAIKAHGGMEWSPYFTDVTAESMAAARELGLRVGPWGLSRGEDIRRMAGLGRLQFDRLRARLGPIGVQRQLVIRQTRPRGVRIAH